MLQTPSRVVASSLQLLPRKMLSRALGRAARVTASRRLLDATVSAYCRAYGIELSEFEVPSAGYATFDAFFTRTLKPGQRPLDADPRALLSPADGVVEDAGPTELGARLKIKGHSYLVEELLGDRWSASLYAGGQFAVIYLSPRDYHRVHAPVDGHVRVLRHVPGSLFPVNSLGVRYVPRLFARNERVVVEQVSDLHGPVASVLVGALGVGRISLSFEPALVTNDGQVFPERIFADRDGPFLQRGSELGIFHLGSTVIVFVGPSSGLQLAYRPGQRVRMGEALFRHGEATREVNL
jgi:phosphatidylserine decarboxylase